MTRVLLDEGVPVGVRRYLGSFTVRTTAEAGWAGLANGELISAAEAAGFDVLITCDQNIRYQQNLTSRTIALVVLQTTHWRSIQAAVQRVVEAVTAAQPGGFTLVTFDRPALRRRTYDGPSGS